MGSELLFCAPGAGLEPANLLINSHSRAVRGCAGESGIQAVCAGRSTLSMPDAGPTCRLVSVRGGLLRRFGGHLGGHRRDADKAERDDHVSPHPRALTRLRPACPGWAQREVLGFQPELS